MTTPGAPVPQILRTADPAARDAVLAGLKVFNDTATGTPQDGGPLSAVLRDGADGPILGGVIGHVYGSWLHLDLFHLPEALRGTGHGTRLVRMLEDEARATGAVGAYVETFSFQARGFYERLGYVLYGEIEGLPPGHVRHALLKRFDAKARPTDPATPPGAGTAASSSAATGRDATRTPPDRPSPGDA